MMVVIKSSPESQGARQGLLLARQSKASVVLIQNGVYLALGGSLTGVEGKAYAVVEDMKLRGIDVPGDVVKPIGYDELVDLMAGDEKVVGLF